MEIAKTISERMKEIIEDNPQAEEWTVRAWADELGVNRHSVLRSAEWLNIMRRRRGDELDELELSILGAMVEEKKATAQRISEMISTNHNSTRSRLRYFVEVGYVQSMTGGKEGGYFVITDEGKKYHRRVVASKKRKK